VDSDHVTIEVIDEAKHNDEQPREHKKNGSFEGFNVSNAAPAMEKQSGL
jgi:mlo protein